MRFLIIYLLLSGCITIDYWKPEDHTKMMRGCRALCGKDRATLYDAVDGQCQCKAN